MKGLSSSAARRRIACLLWLACTLPLGLAWRLAPLHLPPFAHKYGGSGLWAIAVYWLAAAVLPHWRTARLAVLAAVVAVSVECFKLVREPALDGFRTTLAGKLLLGRYFTLGAIVAYLLAIAVTAALDGFLRAPRSAALTGRSPGADRDQRTRAI